MVCALLLFAVSVPVEFYSGELSENSGIIEFYFKIYVKDVNSSDIIGLFNLDQLIPASGAAAV